MAISRFPTEDTLIPESDALQAAYFRGALADQRAVLGAEIGRQTRKLGSLSMKSDAMTISRLRREIRANEAEYRDLDRMIEALDRRFSTVFPSR
jgi:hypothetical protein